jgi:branched-chain amino acid transport system ATP-binding protein
MTVGETLLKVEVLEAGYGEVQVLWGVSFGASTGKLTTIIGANGVGKTTALRAVVGSIRPWGGRVAFKGEDVSRRTSRQRAD